MKGKIKCRARAREETSGAGQRRGGWKREDGEGVIMRGSEIECRRKEGRRCAREREEDASGRETG